MASKVDKGKGVAFAKRAKISKAQQSMLIAIGLASVVLGVTLVGVIYLVKVIRFNMDIISELLFICFSSFKDINRNNFS